VEEKHLKFFEVSYLQNKVKIKPTLDFNNIK